MRFDGTKQEFDTILECLKGNPLRCQKKLRELLIVRFEWMLHPSKAPDRGGWAPMGKTPIRSSWPSGHVKADNKRHWSFDPKTKKKTNAPAPKKQTADEILAEL